MRSKTKQTTDDDEPVRALSDSTIRQTYTILRAGLDGAVRDGLLARNPAALVKRPGIERREAKHLDDADVTAVLRAAQASRYHPVLVLIAATGLRKGEALALRWDRVDIDAAEQCVQVDAGGELVHVQCVDHEVDDTLGDLLGQRLCRVGHSPAYRPKPITRIHMVSISRYGVRGITRRG